MLLARAGSITNPSSENLFSMHRSTGHALMYYIYSEAEHKKQEHQIFPHRSSSRVGAEQQAFAALSLRTDDPEEIITSLLIC